MGRKAALRRRRGRESTAAAADAGASGAMIGVLVLYFAILIGIGWWASRESRSVAGFYVAGKKLPSWVIAFSSNTTGESGWLLLGLTGMGYLVGFHALWVVLGEVIGVALAWSGLASAFTPVVLCSLFWRGTTRAGALAGMIAGFLTAVLWVVLVKEHVYDLYEMIPGFAVGFAVTIGVSLFTKPPPDAGAVLDEVQRVVGGPLRPAAGAGRGGSVR